jgi:hypothetical protein
MRQFLDNGAVNTRMRKQMSAQERRSRWRRCLLYGQYRGYITRTNWTSETVEGMESSAGSQRRQTVKFGHESRGTRKK